MTAVLGEILRELTFGVVQNRCGFWIHLFLTPGVGQSRGCSALGAHFSCRCHGRSAHRRSTRVPIPSWWRAGSAGRSGRQQSWRGTHSKARDLWGWFLTTQVDRCTCIEPDRGVTKIVTRDSVRSPQCCWWWAGDIFRSPSKVGSPAMVGGAVLGGRQCVRVRPCALVDAHNSRDVGQQPSGARESCGEVWWP